MDQDADWYGGRPRPRRHCVRWGLSSLPPKGAQQPLPRVPAHVCCGQSVAHLSNCCMSSCWKYVVKQGELRHCSDSFSEITDWFAAYTCISKHGYGTPQTTCTSLEWIGSLQNSGYAVANTTTTTTVYGTFARRRWCFERNVARTFVVFIASHHSAPMQSEILL